MKYILAGLFFIHGLIHTFGFIKAFDLTPMAVLQAPISRLVGILWLAAALLLIVSGILVLAARKWWWAAGALGVVISQILIINAWSDAKAGSILNIVLLIPVAITALVSAPWSFRSLYDRDVDALLNQPPQQIDLLTETGIAHLPPIVQRYLLFVNAVGKPQVLNYRFQFSGTLRNGPGAKWMQLKADQHSRVNPPTRLFLIDASMFGVPFTAFHRYMDGRATFRVKIASLLKIVDAHGPEMNKSETVTLLNDLFCLAPAALIDRQIRWEELDTLTVRATWTNAGNKVSAVVSFDSSGAMLNFVSDDRSMTVDGKKYENHRWSTPVREWKEFGGRKFPALTETMWDLPDGEFVYGRFEIIDGSYNVMDA